jgi:hypothetical protein
LTKAESIKKVLPSEYKNAYYQLVLHPVQASANINELYITVAKNRDMQNKIIPKKILSR